MASELTICNNALSEIAADPISSIDEASLQARECRRLLPDVLTEFLTWSDWDYTTVRVALALQANARTGEWLYCYAKPSDMAEAIMLVPTFDSPAYNLPAIGPYPLTPVSAFGMFSFIISADAIFTNLENAILQYQSSIVQIGKIRPLEARAIELELSARLAMPIKKSRDLKADMIKQAEVARARAVSENENRSPRMDARHVSEVELARAGGMD